MQALHSFSLQILVYVFVGVMVFSERRVEDYRLRNLKEARTHTCIYRRSNRGTLRVCAQVDRCGLLMGEDRKRILDTNYRVPRKLGLIGAGPKKTSRDVPWLTDDRVSSPSHSPITTRTRKRRSLACVG